MKKFIFHIICFFLVTLFLMYLLDFGYTKIYQNAKPRTKIQYLQKQRGKKIDYIFIGSSRVESGVVPSIIEEKLNKTTLNLGFQAAKLHDIYTVLQLIKYYDIHYEKIFIQVDYSFNLNSTSTIFQPEILPFIHDNSIYNNHIKFNPSNYFKYNYVPFFRYCRNDLKLGFREICLNLASKRTNALNNNGYSPLEGTFENHKFSLPEKINRSNCYLDSIQTFCKTNKIPVIFYCAPFSKQTKNFNYIDKLKSKINGLYDFSSTITDNNLFQNGNHLNDNGAKIFTQIFIDNVLINKK